MSDQVKWNALENSIYLQLPTCGPISKKIRMLEMILYQEAFNLFGVIKKEVNIRKPSRRLKQTKDVRNKIKDLAKAIKSFSDVKEYGELVFPTEELKKGRRVLRSAEDSRKRKWRRKQLQHCFFKDLFKTAKEVITPKVKVSQSFLNQC